MPQEGRKYTQRCEEYNNPWSDIGYSGKTAPRANLGLSESSEKFTPECEKIHEKSTRKVTRRTSARKDVPPEWREQAAVVEWCSYQAILKFCVINIRNEGRRTYAQANVAKMMGMRKGASDLFIARPLNGKCGLFIEMKENREYTPSEMKTETWMAQEAFIMMMRQNGYGAHFAFGADDGIMKIREYLGMKP